MSWGSSTWGSTPWGTGDDSGSAGLLNAFNADPGVDSGVVFKTYSAPPAIYQQNGPLLALGHDQAGYRALVNPGDYVEVSQLLNVQSDANFVRVKARYRPPVVPPPAGLHWEASVLVDDTVVSTRAFLPREPEQDRDWWINLTPFMGATHKIALRLSLVAS